MFGSSNIIEVTLIARRPWGVPFSAAGPDAEQQRLDASVAPPEHVHRPARHGMASPSTTTGNSRFMGAPFRTSDH
jgi:hypothetical protein